MLSQYVVPLSGKHLHMKWVIAFSFVYPEYFFFTNFPFQYMYIVFKQYKMAFNFDELIRCTVLTPHNILVHKLYTP